MKLSNLLIASLLVASSSFAQSRVATVVTEAAVNSLTKSSPAAAAHLLRALKLPANSSAAAVAELLTRGLNNESTKAGYQAMVADNGQLRPNVIMAIILADKQSQMPQTAPIKEEITLQGEINKIVARIIINSPVQATPRVEVPNAETPIDQTGGRYPLPNGKSLVLVPEKLDRNSTYKVFVENETGGLTRVDVKKCSDGSIYNDNLLQASFMEISSHSGRAFVLTAGLSAGAAYAYRALYGISMSGPNGVEICYHKTLLQEYKWHEGAQQMLPTPWVIVSESELN